MTRPVRTRFAPSPTGDLHLGNVRAAVLNWLFAKHSRGAFVLRLEDTDIERNVEGGEARILEALRWLGLDPDEGPGIGGPCGPYRQSEREGRHRERAFELLARGAAFRCFCTPEALDAHRARAIAAGEPPGRDPACRDLPPDEQARRHAVGEPSAIRLRVDSGSVAYVDRVKGALSFDGDDLGDMVLVRSDGLPTYNFAVTVDDLDMRISHVIRGIGHLSNTPKQVLLYRAFDETPPEFVHIPTVLAPGGGKLSKRLGAPGVLEYRDRGFHPDAVVNYLSLLSWSSPSGEEFLSRDELVRQIDLDRIGSTDSEIDEEKMAWLSGQHIRAEPPETLAARWAAFGADAGLGLDEADLVRAARVFAERTRVLADAAPELRKVFAPPAPAPEEAAILAAPEAAAAIELALSAWDAPAEWSPEVLKPALMEASKDAGIRGKALFQPIRLALMGASHGPDLAAVAYALGPGRTRERLSAALRPPDSAD